LAANTTTPALAHLDTRAHPAPMGVRPSGTVLCLAAADLCSIAAAVLLAHLVRNGITGRIPPSMGGLMASAILMTGCIFIAARLYPGVCDNPVDELRRTVLAITLTFLTLGASTFLSHGFEQSRLVLLLAYLFSAALVPLVRAFVRSSFSERSWWGCPVVILGMGDTGRQVLKTLRQHPGSGLKPVAALDDDPLKQIGHEAGLITGPLEKCFEITRSSRISYGIVCMPRLSRDQLLELMEQYGRCFSEMLIIPDLIGMASLGINVREFGGIVGLEVTQSLLRPVSRFVKRALDLLLVLTLAPVVCPLIALAALLIKLDSRGPIFYRDVRIGRGGQQFVAWKLRSMMVNGREALETYLDRHPEERTAWRVTQKLKRDPRITRAGRILRRTSIDELPQFWNVLVGQMSVVGPRPFLPSQIEMYGRSIEMYKMVRPGITGLWQISGRNQLSFEERAQLDAHGIKNWSVWLDVYILARTIPAVFGAKGAY